MQMKKGIDRTSAPTSYPSSPVIYNLTFFFPYFIIPCFFKKATNKQCTNQSASFSNGDLFVSTDDWLID